MAVNIMLTPQALWPMGDAEKEVANQVLGTLSDLRPELYGRVIFQDVKRTLDFELAITQYLVGPKLKLWVTQHATKQYDDGGWDLDTYLSLIRTAWYDSDLNVWFISPKVSRTFAFIICEYDVGGVHCTQVQDLACKSGSSVFGGSGFSLKSIENKLKDQDIWNEEIGRHYNKFAKAVKLEQGRLEARVRKDDPCL